ncbi:MinD/ParA family protein [Williamsia sp. 1135]|uniref:MinD/ParA family ATP-binding protein n=1 Tax=Williamsia sp. 1135 TaxID=1889262 RepID=UPI00117DFC4E|nr:MinD/ParA family protein [Williamsia sp. 1135]
MSYNNADVPAPPPWLQADADIDLSQFERPETPARQPDPSPALPNADAEPTRHGADDVPPQWTAATDRQAAPAPPPVDAQPTPPQQGPPAQVPPAYPQPQPYGIPAQAPGAAFAPAPLHTKGPPHAAPPAGPAQFAAEPRHSQGFAPPAAYAPPPGPPQQGPPQPGPPQPVPGQQYPSRPGPPQPGLQQPGYGQPPPYGNGGYGPASLDEVALLRKARRAPASGWRRTVHKLSAGTINPGESPDDLVYKQLLERVNQPVRGDYRIAVLSLKGGVGKTTTTVGLGSTFASLRGDRVIAVDANPDLGTLAQRIPQQTRSTVRDLLSDESIYRYSDVRAHTSQAPSRLEVLASERDPAVAEAFSETDYRGVMTVLQRFYNIIITDCGTGLSHSAMNGVLDMANALILVTSPAIDGARSAGATLDWLQAHGFGHLVSSAVVVLSSSRPGASSIDTDQLSAHFLTRCRAVQQIPFDDHLAEGAEVDLDLLGKPTRRALVEMAATVADDFPSTTIRRNEPYTSS